MVTVHSGDPAAVELGAAIRAGDLRSLRRLLGERSELGADLNWIPGWDQHTPLDMARGSGAEDLVEWLLSRGARSADQPR